VTVIETDSPESTERLGARLARRLAGGEQLLLVGELGAGKTCFVRGLVAGLCGDPRQVRSPSYNILCQYDTGRMPLSHFDAYFVREPEEFRRTGLEEFLGLGQVVAVEWADRFPEEFDGPAISIRFEHLDGDRRRLTLSSNDPELMKRICGLGSEEC